MRETRDRIELLAESLIEQYPAVAMDVLATSSRLARPLGWHYLLDLIWVLVELERLPGKSRVLDVGAGHGLLQFMLADRGHDVVSADMAERRPLPQTRHLYRFQETGIRGPITHDYLGHKRADSATGGKLLDRLLDVSPRKVIDRIRGLLGRQVPPDGAPPSANQAPLIVNYRCDISDMAELGDETFDAVVSISAVEHNPPDMARRINRECCRVVKRGGVVLHTVSAVKAGTGFHDASHSYLLDEKGLRETFELPEAETNFDRFDEIYGAIREGRYLRKWLAHIYFSVEKSGMPGGVWDPAYQPVGIRKFRQ